MNLHLFTTKTARLKGGQKSVDEACNSIPGVAGKNANMCIGRCKIRRDKKKNKTVQANENTNTQDFIRWNAGEEEEKNNPQKI